MYKLEGNNCDTIYIDEENQYKKRLALEDITIIKAVNNTSNVVNENIQVSKLNNTLYSPHDDLWIPFFHMLLLQSFFYL